MLEQDDIKFILNLYNELQTSIAYNSSNNSSEKTLVSINDLLYIGDLSIEIKSEEDVSKLFKEKQNKQILFKIWDIKYKPCKVFPTERRYKRFKKNVLECDKNARCKYYKVCNTCSVIRALYYKNQLKNKLKANPKLLENKWYYIVTPIAHKSYHSIEETFENIMKLKKSFITKVKNAKRKSRKSTIWTYIQGGIGSIEVTYNDNNGWNFHINWIINSTEEFDISNDTSEEIVKFLKLFNSHKHFIRTLNSDEDLEVALSKVLSYSLKFNNLPPEKLIEAYYVLYKKRLFFSFGNLWGRSHSD